ncbi:MAG: hypothetical protein Q9177_002822 [Variospora cf. flavescens]
MNKPKIGDLYIPSYLIQRNNIFIHPPAHPPPIYTAAAEKGEGNFTWCGRIRFHYSLDGNFSLHACLPLAPM